MNQENTQATKIKIDKTDYHKIVELLCVIDTAD